MYEALFIALGAFLGAISRVWITHLHDKLIYKGIPTATLFVNVMGSLLLGITISIITTPNVAYLFIVIGYLSSLTTFSTFVMELEALWDSNKRYAMQYVILSLILGFLLLAIGFNIGQSLMKVT